MEDGVTKVSYPKSVFFIVSNEFCERFSFYGMKTILLLYLSNILGYEDKESTVFYHAFVMLAYFFPLIGAIISDSWLGKYRTILYLSIVYAIGQLMLAAASVPPFHLPVAWFSFAGLFLVAMGTGGIKPCVSSFGGDQFKLPQQEAQMSSFFSLFYFAINAGSLLSTIITPILRNDVKCYGQKSCFPLAFLVPAVLMVVSVVIFFLGKRLYKIKEPEGNVIVQVSKCIGHAVGRKIKSKEEREHWLDYADDKYDRKLLDDIKAVLQVLKLFIPLPFFWALFDQQGSRWTFQAQNMDGEVFGYVIKPDQFQVLNPLFILLFIPLFKIAIYPVIEKFLFINTPLRKLSVGGFLTGLSFVISALVELSVESAYVPKLSPGFAQARFYNTIDCNASMTFYGHTFDIGPLDVYQNISIPAEKNLQLAYSVNFKNCSQAPFKGTVLLEEGKATSIGILPDSVFRLIDEMEKSKEADLTVRAAIYTDKPLELTLQKSSDSDSKQKVPIASPFNFSIYANLSAGNYDIILGGKRIAKDVTLRTGGIYTVVGNAEHAEIRTVVPPNELHMFWLLPQYLVITMGEIMFSITGLEFAFTQAPKSMKAILTSGWLLTVAFGNLIVVIIAEAHFFDRQVFEFLLFAVLMFIDVIVFSIMATFYKYVDVSPSIENSSSEDVHMSTRKEPSYNDSFVKDDY